MDSCTDVGREGGDKGIFLVHCILSARLESIGTGPEGEELTSWYYKIRWFGYTADDDTCEPEANLECPQLLADFWKHVGGKRLKLGKHSTEYTASPAWIQRQLEYFTEAGSQHDGSPKRKPKSQKEQKSYSKPLKRNTPSDTKGNSVGRSSPDPTVIDSDPSNSQADLFGSGLSLSDSPPVIDQIIRSPLVKGAGRRRLRVIMDKSLDNSDDDVTLATLATRLQKKPWNVGPSVPSSMGSHTHLGQPSACASASIGSLTGSHSSPTPAVTQPLEVPDREPTAMTPDGMKIVPSMLDGKASGDARNETPVIAARVGLMKAIGDTDRHPSVVPSSSAGPSQLQVSSQTSSTQKLGFTKNPKRKASTVFQTSPAKITDKHRGAKVTMVDGIHALPPERPRANWFIYSKLVKKLTKKTTVMAGNTSPPPKLPRLTVGKSPLTNTMPANTRAPSATANNTLSGHGGVRLDTTWGSTEMRPVILGETSGWGSAGVQPPASGGTSGWDAAMASSGWGSLDTSDPSQPQISVAPSSWGLNAQTPAPLELPQEPSGWDSLVEGSGGDRGVLTDELSSICNIEVVDSSSAATTPVDFNNVIVCANAGRASIMNIREATTADETNLGPWIDGLELRLGGGGGATLRASSTSVHQPAAAPIRKAQHHFRLST
ncbi:hypothetical protein FRB95_010722 [Tulasnella sp. JGI-2019a]|nr:hypothetical protein FRB93_012961 [Tulasnella sp. JGI-2019a]KAG9039433.1 hypothetical protein FRB95_010722 [Tulasnella sp. JGI-2019a]